MPLRGCAAWERWLMNDVYTGALRCAVLETGLVAKYREARRQSFFEGNDDALESLCFVYGVELVSRCASLNQARLKRAARVKSKMLDYVLAGSCYFLTLTFTDKVLSSTTIATRRRYVARWLKEHFSDYAANIDFGDKAKNPQSNEREHYHCLARLDGLKPPKKWPYGHIKVQRVKDTEKDAKATAKYAAKLSNHAMKVNGGFAPRLIYSRKH